MFEIADVFRFDGQRQRTLVIRNPSYPDPLQTGTSTIRIPSSIRIASPDLAAPYTWNSELSIEKTFSTGLILTGSYRFVRGIHLTRARNLNAPLDITSPSPRSCSPDQSELTCVRPDPSRGNVLQLESTGLSSDHEVRVGFQQRLSFINIRGNYNARVAYSDVGWDPFDLPADNYDMSTEWGPTQPRHNVES
jgi:hypothetical protein